MKKKRLKLIGVVVVPLLLFVGFVVVIAINGLRFVRISTSNMEPDLMTGELFWISRWKIPEVGRVVCYRTKGEHTDGKSELWVGRIVAEGGDEVKLERGNLFINKTFVDDPWTIQKAYTVDGKSEMMLRESVGLRPSQFIEMDFFDPGQRQMVFLTEVESLGLDPVHDVKRLTLPPEKGDPEIGTVFPEGSAWNKDHWGPATVPEGHFFIMGDNRDKSYDSRWIGFIPEENVLGSVLGDH